MSTLSGRPLERVALPPAFRFVHEPLGTAHADDWHRFVGRAAELDDLVSRIVLSDGGAFLLTGYRGVGKTTFVNRVVAEVRRRLPQAETIVGPATVVDVTLNFARALEPVELLYHILRGLYVRLVDLDLLAKLAPDLQRDLELAYLRTSASVRLAQEHALEHASTVGDLALPVPALRLSLPVKWQAAWKRRSSRETTYLAYDDKAAEHDLITLAQRLTRGYEERLPAWRRWAGAMPPRVKLKLLFVFDELDKLDEGRSPTDRPALDHVLGTLKNLFTTSGISFVFVAGKDLHERWVEDLSRGDSIYESVFAHAQYLPGLWEDAERLADALLGSIAHEPHRDRPASGAYLAFRKYLAFRGRGIPRRIVRGFNEFVRWEGGAPDLAFDAGDIRRFRFYAGLLDTLNAAEEELFGSYRGERSVEHVDKQRLGLYYAIDWILQREQEDFGFDDLLAASRRLSRLIAPVEEAAPGQLQHVLDVLLRAEYLEVLPAHSSTVVGRKVGAAPTRYRIPRRRLLELGAFVGVFEQEAQALFRTPAAPPPPPAAPPGVASDARAPAPPADTAPSRYARARRLAVGGMSSIYLARDLQTGGDVVLKELSPQLAADASLRARAVREGRLLASFDHAGIVKVLDVIEHGDAVSLVMEHVQGLALDEILKHGPLVEQTLAARVIHEIADALAYVHARGVIWRDPKPANVLVTPEGRVVLIDFGVARVARGSDTDAGMLIGTLGYMSPEQLHGAAVDTRSDVFGLGALVYEMLTTRKAFAGTLPEIVEQLTASGVPPPPSSVEPQAAAFDALVARCLAREPAHRPAAADVLAMLPQPLAPPHVLGAYVSGLHERDSVREQSITQVSSESPAALPAAQPPAAPPAVPVPVPPRAVPSRTPSTWPGAVAAYPAAPTDVRRGPGFESLPDGRWYPLDAAARVTIGRSADNDIVLDDSAVSRYAARIFAGTTLLGNGQHTYYVEELNSANGVFLDGDRLFEVRRLGDGAVLSLGPYALRFVAG